MNRKLVLALGVAAVVAETALWHGPLGAGEQMAGKIERTARRTIEHYEMPLVTARAIAASAAAAAIGTGRRFPARRAGADHGRNPGRVRRSLDNPAKPGGGAGELIPLIVEACAMSLVGFSIGLLLAYLIELRRRANAEWRWG